MVVPNLWVWRHDGSIQCDPRPGQSLQEAREQLESLIGAENVLDAEKRELPCIIPKMCGIPTARVNACFITVQGYLLLIHGFPGPMGWRPWTDDCPEDWADAPFAALAAARRGVSEEEQPRAVGAAGAGGGGGGSTAIEDLYGRRCRCYTQGDALTQDYIPERVNIGLNQRGRIVEIWFG
jgi:hypothetical protein